MEGKKKLILQVGEEFYSLKAEEKSEISAETINAVTNARESNTRTVISYVIVGMIIVFLLGAAISSIHAGKFDALRSVWGIAGPLTGAIIGYYYRFAGE